MGPVLLVALPAYGVFGMAPLLLDFIQLSALLGSVPQAVLFYAVLCGGGVFTALAATATSSHSQSPV